MIAGIFLLMFGFFYFEIYAPLAPDSHEMVIFTVEKGWGDEEIADKLFEAGLIRNSNFFKFYGLVSVKHISLQAGKYNLSPKMSIHDIATKMARGEVIREKILVYEGWTEKDIAEYFELKGFCAKDEFFSIVQNDYSSNFDFLADKPADLDLEGYLFPDTYEVSIAEDCEDMVGVMLSNFGEKLTPELRAEIENQGKSIFDIVIMASLLEKEMRTPENKKIASGILWKRLSVDMPLQLDATVNYITGKNDPGVSLKDAQVDSPYNTYKYKGLPKGPISNPGMDSITAAIYPTETKYWFYLSDGKTIFSETIEQHNAAKAKYLK